MKNPFSRDKQKIGQLGEELALKHLTAKGLKLVTRNYRCKGGEIDLIMQDKESLVFVEVRYRKTQAFGGAAASVTATKQRRLILAARHYLMKNRIEPACRFDVIALEGDAPVNWIKNAFDLSH